MKQNITLSIEKDLIKKGKIMAAEQDISVSQLLTNELEKIILNTEKYRVAQKSALNNLGKKLKLGGITYSNRDELYER